MNALQLSIRNGHWWAEWMGDERENVVGLFGSAVLPCPYQASVPFETVAQSLRAANPGYMIVPPIPAQAWPRLHAAVDRLRQTQAEEAALLRTAGSGETSDASEGGGL